MSEQDRSSRPTDISRLVLGLIALVSSALAVVPAVTLPYETMGRIGAAALLVIAIFNGGRVFVRLCSRYFNWPGRSDPPWTDIEPWTDADRRALNQLVLVDVDITVAATVAGAYFLAWPAPGIQIAVSLVLGLISLVTTFKTHDLVWPKAPGGPPRGSDVVEDCPPVQAVRIRTEEMETAAGFLKKLYRTAFAKTPFGELSWLAVLIMFAFFAVSGSQGVAVISGPPPPVDVSNTLATTVDHWRRRPEKDQHKDEDEKDQGGSGAPGFADDPAQAVATYEDYCGRAIVPGDSAPSEDEVPSELRAGLRDQWYSYGFDIVGCATYALRVPGTDVYYVAGYFPDREFVSLGVASPTHPAVVLLASPARRARQLAKAGTLRGASERQSIGNGDFHVIYARDSGWVEIRRNKSQRYVELPPLLARLWLRFNQRVQKSWPKWAPVNEPGSRYYNFKSEIEPETTVASGYCASDDACELVSGPSLFWDRDDVGGAPAVTAENVLAYGPSR